MNSSPTLWLDVTTLMTWTRPPTGVVRVEAELFHYFHRRPELNVRYCSFDAHNRHYLSISSDQVVERIQRFHHQNAPASHKPQVAEYLMKQANQLIRQAPAPLYRQLAKMKRSAEPMAREMLHKLRQAPQQGRRSFALPTRSKRRKNGARNPFSNGSVLVSAGLDWDFKDLRVLYELKQTLGMKVISFCYDLIPILFPHLCRPEVSQVFPKYFADVAWCSDLVLCISKSTQRDFEAFVADAKAPRVATGLIRLGATLSPPVEHVAGQSGLPTPYLLYVSTLERRKNHEILYKAMVKLAAEGRKNLPTIVCVGMPGWGTDELLNDLNHDPRVKSVFVVKNTVSDAELSSLYRDALFTVYPSLYEGWGLPVAESLAHGKFCISSNSSSLPEVGGDWVEYLDPWDTQSWASRIAFFLDHPQSLAARQDKIASSYVSTPWSDAGDTVLSAAQALVGTQQVPLGAH